MPSQTMNIAHGSALEKKILDRIRSRVKFAETTNTDQHERWRAAEERVLCYVPESELDAKRRARRDSGKHQYLTLQVPYTYALLMSAHTYWTSVFFSRTPVHQYAGRHGETEQQTQALEALIDYQVSAGGMMGPYYIWLYDTGKYGQGILGDYWEKEESQIATVETDPTTRKKILSMRNGITYEGNKVYNVSPFDFLPDPRVPLGQFQKGEFCAVRKRISWNDIIRRTKRGYYTNIEALKTSVGTSEPAQDSYSALIRPKGGPSQFNNEDGHPTLVEGYEVYVELLAKDWGLTAADTLPQKWVFTCSKDFSVLFGCQPLGLLHNRFPFNVLESEIEAYGFANRGIPEIIEPLQDTMDWLVNSHYYNVRAVLNNTFLLDPTKVVLKDFENTEPGGFIRLKPEAYGQDLNTFFKQLETRDVTQTHFNDLQLLQGMGERALGINDQIMGALTGGGRKTATEVRTSTGFGVNRLKTTSEYFSSTGFSEHSQMLVMNTQQYFTTEKKFRIVGSLIQEAGPQFINVTPESILGFYDFVPVDGVLPIDRMAQANLWKEILLNIGRVPQIAQQYDIVRMFAWMTQMAGLKNVNKFKVQVLPPGAGPSPGMVAAPNNTGLPTRMPQSSTVDTGLTL